MIRVRTFVATSRVIATSTSHPFAAELGDAPTKTKSRAGRDTTRIGVSWTFGARVTPSATLLQVGAMLRSRLEER